MVSTSSIIGASRSPFGHELHAVTRLKEEDASFRVGRVEEFCRRVPDEVPAAGRGHWVDAGMFPANRYRAGWNTGSRRRQTRRMQPRVQIAQVGKARSE